jgi:hypothetical protein
VRLVQHKPVVSPVHKLMCLHVLLLLLLLRGRAAAAAAAGVCCWGHRALGGSCAQVRQWDGMSGLGHVSTPQSHAG